MSADGVVVAELSWRSARNHSVELAPAINRILEQAGAGFADLAAVFVSEGPGAFSALRVGMSAAKAIASARSIPLAVVGAMDAEMMPYLGMGLPICAIASAGRTRLYVGRRGADGAEIDLDVAPTEEFLASVESGALYCGEGTWELSDEIRRRAGAGALIADSPPPTRRASAIASIGYRRLLEGDTANAATVEPVYLRSSQIESASRRWMGG